MADEAQPEVEGQGEAGSGGLFDSYLQAVPENARDYVRPFYEDAAKNVNGRLEEAAELRRTYEPLSQVEGLTQYNPEELAQLVAWHQQVAASPDSYQEWLVTAAREAGLMPAEEQVEEPSELTPDQVRAWTQESISPLEMQIQELRTQQFISSEAQLVADRFADIERENHVSLTAEQKDMIVDLGLGAMPDDDASLVNGQDWIGAGFTRFREIAAQAEQAFVSEKSAQPKPAVPSGGVGVFELPKTFEEAGERARERLRQSRT